MDSYKPSKFSFKGKCNYCKIVGHKAIDCYKKKREEKETAVVATLSTTSMTPESGLSSAFSMPASKFVFRSYPIFSLVIELKNQTNICLLSVEGKFFVVDSGCTWSVTYDRSLFTDLKPHRVPIRVASGEVFFTEGIGSVGSLTEVLYAPMFKFSLLSVGKITKSDCKVIFDEHSCQILRRNGFISELGIKGSNDLYMCDVTSVFGLGLCACPLVDEIVSCPAQLLNMQQVMHNRCVHMSDP
jgi:hypothetical protein